MNTLEVFNKVEEHLLSQGERSVKYLDVSVYRGEYGMSCAIGCLIKDEFYHEGLEGIGMWAGEKINERQIMLEEALVNSGINLSCAMTRMLKDLQSLHDTVNFEVWEQSLQDLRATYFGAV
jgi:hypothetical protein